MGLKRAIHLAHATLAHQRRDLVRPELIAWGSGILLVKFSLGDLGARYILGDGLTVIYISHLQFRVESRRPKESSAD